MPSPAPLPLEYAILGTDGTQAPDTGALLAFARTISRELRLRSDIMPHIDEPRWMILLDIYLAMSEDRDTPFMSAAHASSAPVSTAQRYIHEMTEAGLIAQHRSGQDQRVTLVILTGQGRDLVTQALERMATLRGRSQGNT